MAGARQSAREPGKSDPIDALSVARAALREPNLPAARLEGAERELRLLVDHRAGVLAGLEAELANRPELSARISRDLVVRIRELTMAIDELEREIQGRIGVLAPTLLSLAGCGQLSAAKLVGETGGIDRFRSRAAFAAHNGTAPVPVWSGNIVHRLSVGLARRPTGAPSGRDRQPNRSGSRSLVADQADDRR